MALCESGGGQGRVDGGTILLPCSLSFKRVQSEVREVFPTSHLETETGPRGPLESVGCLESFHLCGVQFSGWNQIL